MFHACNPTYSGGRDQEDHGSKQPGKIVCKTLSQKKKRKRKRKKKSQKKGW
jgi:23S rRNA A1618 N6-methylase RlmF